MVDLPHVSDQLKLYQLEALVSYGIDIEKLYPDGYISVGYRDSLREENDPVFSNHKSKFSYMRSKKIKSKRVNDYTRSRKFSLCSIHLKSEFVA